MSFTDKKTLSVAEAVKTVLSKKVDPNDPNDPRNFRASDPKMLDKINTALKNSQAVKIAYDVADSFGKLSEPSEKPKSIPYMPDYKRVSNREISGPITRKKQDVNEAQTQSGTVMRNAGNVLRAAQNPSQDKPSTEKQRLGMKYYEKKSYPNSTSSSSQPKPSAKPNQDKVDTANRVQSGQRATVMSSPSAKDSEDLQSAKRDVISSAMRKQQDMERLNQLADKDTNNDTSIDKDTTAPDNDINRAVKQAKEPKQDFDQEVKELDVTDTNKSKKTNEEKQMTTFRDAAIKALYETKKKADKDYDKDGKIESPKDEVWGSRLRAAKMAGKLKEEEQIDEAFPTVADGEKSLKAKEGKTTHGKITKTKTGMKHERDYDDQPEPEVKRGRGRPKKRLSEMRQEYFNYFEEEVDNETFTKELKDQKAKFDGKKKGADVAKASVQAVKQEEVEQIDELSKKTLGSYIKKANARQTDDYHDAGSMDVEPERRDGIARTEKINRAVDKLVSKKTNEEVEQIDELSHDTLRSYVDKAKKENLPGKGGNRGVALLTPGTRDKGVHRAVDKLKKMKANEEVEQIDEISADLAGKYLTASQGKGANKYKVSSDKSVYPNIETMTKHSTNVRRALKRSEGSSLYKKPDYYKEEVEQIDEVSPPGREDQVKALKKVPGIDNPWAVAWASYRKSHPKKSKD